LGHIYFHPVDLFSNSQQILIQTNCSSLRPKSGAEHAGLARWQGHSKYCRALARWARASGTALFADRWFWRIYGAKALCGKASKEKKAFLFTVATKVANHHNSWFTD